MTMSRDSDRLIRAFLDEGEEELHDRVYDAVRADIDQKRQRAVIGPWRTPIMNKFATYGLVAAAVVVAALVGAQLLWSPSGGVGTQPTPTAEPTATPEPTSTPEAGLPVGPFSFEPEGSFSSNDSGMAVTVTIPAARWGFDTLWNLLGRDRPPDAPFTAFWAFPQGEFYVPSDPCRADSTMPDTPVITVEELAAALAAQPSRNGSEPVDVMVGGYAGKLVTLHAPAGVDESDCERDKIVTYALGPGSAAFFRNTQREDEVSELRILDVNGTIVIIDTVSSPGTSVELIEEMESVIESTTFQLD